MKYLSLINFILFGVQLYKMHKSNIDAIEYNQKNINTNLLEIKQSLLIRDRLIYKK